VSTPTNWPWPISVDRIFRGGFNREAELKNRLAGNVHVDKYREALAADGWAIEPTYSHEPATSAWRAKRGGFVMGGLCRPPTDDTIPVPEVYGWCPKGIALSPLSLAYPGFDAIAALARHCPVCGKDDVDTVRVAFANRACPDCAPGLRQKLETPGWCD
jgi:ribosomal protein S27AE